MISIEDTIKEDLAEESKLSFSIYTILNFGTGVLAGIAIDSLVEGNYKKAALAGVAAIGAGVFNYYQGKDTIKSIDRLKNTDKLKNSDY